MNINYCADCKYFEEDDWAVINRKPVIVNHDICYYWNPAGVKVDKDGFCYKWESKNTTAKWREFTDVFSVYGQKVVKVKKWQCSNCGGVTNDPSLTTCPGCGLTMTNAKKEGNENE